MSVIGNTIVEYFAICISKFNLKIRPEEGSINRRHSKKDRRKIKFARIYRNRINISQARKPL